LIKFKTDYRIDSRLFFFISIFDLSICNLKRNYMQNSYLVKGDKVLCKGDGATVWTVDSTIPTSRNRINVSCGARKDRRAFDSLRKISAGEQELLDAFNSVINP
jgi:hypothetical protein